MQSVGTRCIILASLLWSSWCHKYLLPDVGVDLSEVGVDLSGVALTCSALGSCRPAPGAGAATSCCRRTALAALAFSCS
jgi:hypothetical protein